MIGKMTPPSEEPAAVSPSAIPLFLKNHVMTQVIPGPKSIEAPMAEQTDWLKKKCQYFVLKLVIIAGGTAQSAK